MSTPEAHREMFLDAQAQTEEWNRDQRAEYDAAAVAYDPRDNADHPDARDLAQTSAWDRETERRQQDRERS